MKTRNSWWSTDAPIALMLMLTLPLAAAGVWLAQRYDLHSFKSRESIRDYENEPIMKELAEIKELLKKR